METRLDPARADGRAAMPPPGAPGHGRARWARRVGVVAVVLGAELLLGLVVARRPELALALVAGGAAVLVALVFPRAVLVVGLVSPFLTTRIGPASADLSVTDAYTIVAFVAAVRFVSLRDLGLRRVLWALAAYLAVVAVTVVANPSAKAVVELGHRGLVYGMAVLVGVAIVRSGRLRPALRLFVAACAVTAVLAVVESAANGFAPAYPLDLQKNAAGLLLAAGVLVLLTGRRWLALGPGWYPPLLGVVGAGLVAAQSRSAFLALAVVLVVRVVLAGRRRPVGAGTRLLLVVGCVALAAFAWTTIRDQDLNSANREFQSVDTRVDAYDYALERWEDEPIFGIGLRYWVDATTDGPAGEPVPVPHSMVVGELGEGGLVALLALAGLLGVTGLTLARRRTDLADLGLDVFVLRVVQGVVEIFWVAGPLTLGTLFVGVGLGDDPDERDEAAGEPPASRRVGDRRRPGG